MTLDGISKRAFDSDVQVGALSASGPPGYMSVSFHTKMARQGHLYKLTEDGLIVGGAILFLQGDELNVGRIFVAPEYFRKGYLAIEKLTPLTGDHPEYQGWVALERVLNQKPRV